MICKNCGEKMSDTARFCPNCGYERKNFEQLSKKADNEIKYTIKPEFNFLYKIVETTCWALLYYVMIMCFGAIKWCIEFPIAFLISYIIMFLFIIIRLVLEKKRYENTEYNFYATKIEYKNFLFTEEKKELKYANVREVVMHQGVFERICGIGTIRIYTNASSGHSSASHSSMSGANGIFIHCVSNVHEQYEKVKEIIDEGTPDE